MSRTQDHVWFTGGSNWRSTINTNADAFSRISVVTQAQCKQQVLGEGNVLGSGDIFTRAHEDISQLLREHHDNPFEGHPGDKRMQEKKKRKYSWKGMRKDIEEYVVACEDCQLSKLGKATKVPMVICESPSFAFEVCAMDIVGLLTESDAGNKYILTFQDVLTKFSKAIPIPDQEGNTIARGFVEGIICEYGARARLLTDQGPNFVGSVFKDTCRLLKIDKIQTTAYHSQTNGVPERMHRTLAEYLRSFINEEQRDWDKWLPYAVFSFNATPSSSTKLTPFELIYGRVAELLTALKQPPRLTYCYEINAQKLLERLRHSQQKARENLENSKETAKRQYDKDAKDMEFKVGDQVLLKNDVVRRGKSKKWHKP
uniref:RNA-directed DNA polymerase n=1 Tax=Bracon brevicornis TaxID=1563983 RepID=A0A6V7JLW2_9HYME